MNKLVSVIMSTYNEEVCYLKQSIDSLLNQTYTNLEIVIVNDNPQNDTLRKVLKSFREKDNRIRLIENATNIGLPRSLNKALEYCSGEYIARMDADDVSLPNRIELEVEYLNQHPQCDLVCGKKLNIDEQGNPLRTKNICPASDKSLMKSLDFACIIVHPSVMLRASAITKAGGYNPFLSAQDYDLWLRLRTMGCKFHYMRDVLLQYRIRNNSITKSKSCKQFICASYARYLNKNSLVYDECEFVKYEKKMLENKSFQEYLAFSKSWRGEKGYYLKLLRLVFSNRYFWLRVYNSLMVNLLKWI